MWRPTALYRLHYVRGVRATYTGSVAAVLDGYLQQDGAARHAANLPVSQRYFYTRQGSNRTTNTAGNVSGMSPQHQLIQLRLGEAQLLTSTSHGGITNLNEAHPLYFARTSPREAGLTIPLVLALKQLRIHRLTELQGALIPLLLKGKHVIAHSETGTGKSFGIALAIANRIVRDQVNYRLHTVVLVPTEELALQYDKWLRHFGGCTAQTVQAAIDSIPLETQLAKLHNIQPHVLVGTPQRVADIARLSPNIWGEKLRRKVDCVILDEADIILQTPIRYGRQRLTGAALVDRIFRSQRDEVPAQLVAASATVDGATAQTINAWMRNDKAVRLTTSFVEHTIPPTIEFYFYAATRQCTLPRALTLMLKLICKQYASPRILLFTSEAEVAEVCALMSSSPFRKELEALNPKVARIPRIVAPLHSLPTEADDSHGKGTKNGGKRPAYQDIRPHQVVAKKGDVYVKNNSSLSQFNEGGLLVGVGEFAVSRGLHVSGITHVILYGDCPPSSTFVHCAGRTGRMGAQGDVITLFRPSSGRTVQQVCHSLELPFHPGRIEEVERLLGEGVDGTFGSAASLDRVEAENIALHEAVETQKRAYAAGQVAPLSSSESLGVGELEAMLQGEDE